jgi:hypothetical protein
MVTLQLGAINKSMYDQYTADAKGNGNQDHNRTYRGRRKSH